MRIKSFKGRNAAEALKQVKTDMGDSALIIETKKLRDRGLLGVFSKTGVEIVAAVDDRRQTPDPGKAAPKQAQATESAERPHRKRPSAYDQLVRRLINTGIEQSLAGELADDVRRLARGGPLTEPGRLSEALAKAVSRQVRTSGDLTEWSGDTRTIAFVGPTGVGKTTTIAKLAATLALHNNRRVELITIDAHRLAAVEQLKSSGELMGLRVQAAYTPEEFAAAVKRASRADFILVDTPGCSYRDTSSILELEQYFRAVPGLEVDILLSCSWKLDDALGAVNAFKSVVGKTAPKDARTRRARLLFTKLDETTSRGSVVSVAAKARLPLSYMCDGQEIPDDIEVTTPEILSKLLLADNHSKREGSA